MEPKVINVGKALVNAYQQGNEYMFWFLAALGRHYCSYTQDLVIGQWELLTTEQQIYSEMFISQSYLSSEDDPVPSLFVKMDYLKKFSTHSVYRNMLSPMKMDQIYSFTEAYPYRGESEILDLLDGTPEEIQQLKKENVPYILDFSQPRSVGAFSIKKAIVDYQLRERNDHNTEAMIIVLKELQRQFDEIQEHKLEFEDEDKRQVNTYIHIEEMDDTRDLYVIRFTCFPPFDRETIEITVTLYSLDEVMRYFDLKNVLMAYAFETPFLTYFDFS